MDKQKRLGGVFASGIAAWAALIFGGPAYALDVSGPVTAATTWSAAQSPYRVTADVTVDGGATLFIEPGVTVYMQPGTSLTVKVGALRAQGRAALPIVITAASDTVGGTPAPGSWGNLRFLNGTIDAATLLEHVEVRYGQGVVIESAAPTLNYVKLANNSGPAISIDLAASPAGIGLEATGNGINGVLVPSGDILGSVLWGLQGVPYVVAQGLVGVGQSPTLTGINPNQIQQGEVLDATIEGVRLDGVDRVTFSNAAVTATILPGGTSTAIPVRLAASAAAPLGTLGVTVQVASGEARLDTALNVVQLQPRLISVTPSTIYFTQPDRTITILGANFLPTSTVMWTEVTFPTTFVNDSTLTATVPGLGTGVKRIVVVTPDPRNPGESLTSNSVPLTIALANLTLAPATLAITQGGNASLTLSIPHPAPAAGQSVVLTSSSAAVTVPSSVTIPPGATSVQVPVTALQPGAATITARRVNFNNGVATVNVVLPPETEVTQVHATPNPLALPPDNVQRQFTINIPASNVARTFALSAVDSTVVAVSPTSLTLPAGQTRATANVTGLKAGQTVIRLSADDLPEPHEIVVYVTADFRNMDFMYGKVLGVVRGDPTTPPVTAAGNPRVSAVVGVVKGDSTAAIVSSPGNPRFSAVVGVVKGDPTLPLGATPSGLTTSVPVGITKGDPTSPPGTTPSGLVASPIVGVTR